MGDSNLAITAGSCCGFQGLLIPVSSRENSMPMLRMVAFCDKDAANGVNAIPESLRVALIVSA